MNERIAKSNHLIGNVPNIITSHHTIVFGLPPVSGGGRSGARKQAPARRSRRDLARTASLVSVGPWDRLRSAGLGLSQRRMQHPKEIPVSEKNNSG